MKRILPLIIFLFGIAHNPAKAGADGQPAIDAAQLERQIHRQINRERQNHGLSALLWDEQLAEIARNHSQDMAQHNFFSHFNLQQEGPSERGKRQGWDKQKQIASDTWAVGPTENIYLNHLYDTVVTTTQEGITIKKEYAWKTQEQIAQSTVRGWMNSPSHRKNILSPQYDRQGLGVAISGNNIYVTEDMF